MVFFLDAPIKALYCGRVSDSYLQYFLRYQFLSSDRQTDRWTESDAYEPTVQYAQVGSKRLNTVCWLEGADGGSRWVLDHPFSLWQWLRWYSEASCLSVTELNWTSLVRNRNWIGIDFCRNCTSLEQWESKFHAKPNSAPPYHHEVLRSFYYFLILTYIMYIVVFIVSELHNSIRTLKLRHYAIIHSEKNLKEPEWQYHSELENMWFASHLNFFFFIGMGFTSLLHILFLFENGKPVQASSEWNFHLQTRYQFWECLSWKRTNRVNLLDIDLLYMFKWLDMHNSIYYRIFCEVTEAVSLNSFSACVQFLLQTRANIKLVIIHWFHDVIQLCFVHTYKATTACTGDLNFKDLGDFPEQSAHRKIMCV